MATSKELIAAALQFSMSQAQQKRAEARERLQRAREEYDQAEGVIRGLEALMAEHEVESASTATPTAKAAPTPVRDTTEKRTEAIISVLTEARPERMQAAEIATRLQELGHDVDATAVTRSLTAMRRAGRVWTPGRLQGWALAEDRPEGAEDSTDDAGPAEAEEETPGDVAPALTGPWERAVSTA